MNKCRSHGHNPLDRNYYPPVALDPQEHPLDPGKDTAGNTHPIALAQRDNLRIEINYLLGEISFLISSIFSRFNRTKTKL